ncbi:MAG: carboxypeptidase regulatory-like domain-containing protein [Caldilineaceae bacterium]
MSQPPIFFPRSLFRQLAVLLGVGAGLALLLFITQQTMADEKSVSPDAPGSISGVVTDHAGVPLPGIVITAFQQTNNYGLWQVVRVVQTDQTGAYRISLLSAGLYRLFFSDPSGALAQIYYPNATVIDTGADIPVAGNAVKNVNMALGLGGRITGTVTSLLPTVTSAGGGGGSLPSNVTYYAVRVFQKIGVQWFNVRAIGLSPQQPIYTLTGLPEGTYRVCISSASPPESYINFDPAQECYANVYALNDGDDIQVKAGATTGNINFVLGDGTDLAKISGQVTTAAGAPLAKITVTAMRVYTEPYGTWVQYTQTNSAGVYQLANLLPGPYEVSFTDNSGAYVSEIYSDVLRNSTQQATLVRLARREQRQAINAQLAVAGHISGTLKIVGEDINQSTNNGVVLYQVSNKTWQPTYFSRPIDAQTGHYQVDGLPAGVYKIGGYASINNLLFQGFYGGNTLDAAPPLTLTTGETKSNIDLQLTQAFTVTPFSGQISGTVTSAGAPVAGIKVSIYQNNCCIYPPPITPGPTVTPVPIPTATPAPNQAATNSVAGVNAAAAADAVRPLVYVYTDAQGHYVIDGLLDGDYYLGFSDPNGVYATTYYQNHLLLAGADRLTLHNGRLLYPSLDPQFPAISMALVRAGGISGNVQLKEGTPIANVLIGVYVYSDQLRWELLNIDNTTDATGHYTVKGLPAGVYRLCFADLTGKYPVECDGVVDNYNPDDKTGIVVQAGMVANVNHVLGPKLKFFLPLAARELACGEITEISSAECAALFAIYKSPNQSNSILGYLGWFKSNQPCHWYGIVCDTNHVVRLTLDDSGLLTLPVQVGDLVNLQLLSLARNPLKTIPDELGNLTNLQRLSLSQIGMTAAPKTLGRLHNLQWLDLSVNPITSIAPELGDLSNLTLLAMSQANLSNLPAFFGRLSNLRELYLPQNQLTALPPELGQLKNLQTLDLHDNHLTSLPASLGDLTSLLSLNLTINQLSTLPSELGRLNNLQTLSVRSNQLQSLPATFSDLVNLRLLYIDSNPTLSGSLPASFTKLHLSSFWFNNTKLCEPTTAAFQIWLSQIPDLQRSGLRCAASP